MKVKKQKRNRKSVRFFTACFDFRAPFKILCDGTFIHHLHFHSIPFSNLSTLLSAPTKLFLTRCILAELKSLGNDYSASLQSARLLPVARCDHEQRKSAAGCFQDVIGENNSEHFFLATQDADLRKKFREIPGVPLIFGLRNSLFLEPPSQFQRQFVTSAEEERLHMKGMEFKMLNKRLASEAVTDTFDTNEGLKNEVLTKEAIEKAKKKKKMLGVVDKVQFKRKKAKGPNPLSCKKKKSNAPSIVQNQERREIANSTFGFMHSRGCVCKIQAIVKDGDAGKRKRNRKRKRHQKNGDGETKE